MAREVFEERTESFTTDVEDEPVSPSVVGIFISPAKDEDMQEVDYVRAFAGEGLEGDRYRIGIETGTYSHHGIPEDWRNITLISQQGIDDANTELVDTGKEPFTYSQTRRNVVIRGVSPEQLNALVEGRQSIWIGHIQVQVMKTAPPCDVPEEQYGKEGFRSAFEKRGGVRGRIVNTGIISREDMVSFVPPQVPANA